MLYRRRYFAEDIGSFAPGDDWLDAAQAGISRGVAEMACRPNQASRCFAKAADNLARCAQLRLSREGPRQPAESQGRAVPAAERAGAVPPGWPAGGCFTHDERGRPAPLRRVYLGCGGAMVPAVTQPEKGERRQAVKAKRRRRGRRCRPLPRARPGADESFKEIKIVTYYDGPAERRPVVLTRRDGRHAGALTRQAAGRAGLGEADGKVAVVDGAPRIRNQTAAQGLPPDAVGLDYYHSAQNVHRARRAAYGEEEGEGGPGKSWSAQVLRLAEEADYARPREALGEWAFRWRGAKREAAVALLAYVSAREGMIRYKGLLEAGRQIGSGPTESVCKATTLRVKGVGKKWDTGNAEAITAREALDHSGLWEKYWNLPPLLPR